MEVQAEKKQNPKNVTEFSAGGVVAAGLAEGRSTWEAKRSTRAVSVGRKDDDGSGLWPVSTFGHMSIAGTKRARYRELPKMLDFTEFPYIVIQSTAAAAASASALSPCQRGSDWNWTAHRLTRTYSRGRLERAEGDFCFILRNSAVDVASV